MFVIELYVCVTEGACFLFPLYFVLFKWCQCLDVCVCLLSLDLSCVIVALYCHGNWSQLGRAVWTWNYLLLVAGVA